MPDQSPYSLTLPGYGEPAVALGIRPPEAPASPLATVGAFANIQNALNQNRLFQQTFAARQQAGEIMAQSPDLETGLSNLMRSPAAPFMGEFLNQVRSSQLAQAQYQGAIQGQARDIMGDFGKGLLPLISDPGQWSSIVQSKLAQTAPEARGAVAEAMNNTRTALMDGLQNMPPSQQISELNKRVAAWALASGQNPDAIYAAMGTVPPQIIQRQVGGGATQPVVVGGLAGAGPQPAGGGGLGQLSPPTLTKSQEGYTTERGQKMSSYEENLDTSVLNNQLARRNMQEIVDAAHTAATGGGAETYMRLGQALQALGVSNKTVDAWANGSLAASQVIDKVSLGNAMSSLRQQIPPGSRANITEFMAYLQKNPNISTDPRAMLQVFNYWNSIYDKDKAEQQALDKYKSTGGDITRWPATWANSPYMQRWSPTTPFSGEGIRGVPQVPEALRGVPGLQYSASRGQYKDSTGKVYDKSGKLVSGAP
jgi:hypothetical protein